MSDRIQLELLAASGLLLVVVLELVRGRKLTEEYSFLWIFAALALLVVSMRQDMLRLAARWIGVSDPPAVLLVGLGATVFIASLCLSVIVSRQRQQIERLIEETAILSAELRDLRAVPATKWDSFTRVTISCRGISPGRKSTRFVCVGSSHRGTTSPFCAPNTMPGAATAMSHGGCLTICRSSRSSTTGSAPRSPRRTAPHSSAIESRT